MGLRINKGSGGESPLNLTHRVLNDCGYNNATDKAEVAGMILGKEVVKIEDLTVEELSLVSQKIVRFVYTT